MENRQEHSFDVTGSPDDPGNVILRFKLCFGAATQVMQDLSNQIWKAASMELAPNMSPEGTPYPPDPIEFSLVGRLAPTDGEISS